MDFKKELIFAFIRKLGATIVNVDHTISKTCTDSTERQVRHDMPTEEHTEKQATPDQQERIRVGGD